MKILTDKEYVAYQQVLGQVAKLIAEREGLQKNNEIMAREIQMMNQKRPPIDVRVGEPSPVDKEQRKLYVAAVAGLHKDILEPKLKQMISGLYEMLEDASNDREYDQAIKGSIYFAWEMIRWGERMVNEQIANQQGETPGSPDEKIIPKTEDA